MPFRPCLLVAALVLGAASPTLAEPERAVLPVEVDHARVLKLPRPATTVIIGNPAIADVSVQDATTLVLTGRSFGRTNLIVLDADGQPVIDQDVGVRASEAGTVRVYRQAARQTLACAPECEPTVAIGDEMGTLAGTIAQFSARESMAAGAAK